MRGFYLDRSEDASGVSGTGRVAEGVEFTDGRCALAWLGPISSVAIYPNIKQLEAIHGHEGRTKVVFEGRFQVKEKE
jgi:hypothetical protein